MSYSSDALKKEYHNKTDSLRKSNLKKLREEISCLSLTDFGKAIGITKNDICMLENGDKTLSLFHIQAYKKYFLERHGIDLSVDFLMGYTDIKENNNAKFQSRIGLSADSIKSLQKMKSNDLLMETINTLFSKEEKLEPLLYNLRLAMGSDYWIPCVALTTEDNYSAGVKYFSDYEFPAFQMVDKDGTGGVLIVSADILKSHALLKIQEILNDY